MANGPRTKDRSAAFTPLHRANYLGVAAFRESLECRMVKRRKRVNAALRASEPLLRQTDKKTSDERDNERPPRSPDALRLVLRTQPRSSLHPSVCRAGLFPPAL